jgi:hypothetical protein
LEKKPIKKLFFFAFLSLEASKQTSKKAIWNINAKFQLNRFRNGNFSSFFSLQASQQITKQPSKKRRKKAM